MNLKLIDLFAGIGGIRLGFQQVFPESESVFSSEINPLACKTYFANFKENSLNDITKVKESEIPDFDILLAGFPCQAFSIAGKRQGFSDTRGTLFFDVARIIAHKQPRCIFLENVKGLISHDKGKTLKVILSTLDELGYEVKYQVLNAKDYGLPQKRERIYLVGFHREKVKGYENFKFPAPHKTKVSISQILESNVDINHFISEKYWQTLKAHKERHQSKGNGFGYEIVPHEGIANTVVVGGMGKERNLVKDLSLPVGQASRKLNEESVRVMTNREWARLQGYPDSFVFPCSKSATYKQLGNSVAIKVISAIAAEIKLILK